MKKITLAGGLLLSTAFSAFAADLPTRVAPVPVYVPPPPIWTGPFIGGSLGGSWSNPGNDTGGDKILICTQGPNCSGYPGSFGSYGSAFNRTGSSNDTTFAPSIGAGYNLQVAPNFVLGGLVDLTYLGKSANRTATGPSVYVAPYDEQTVYRDSFSQDWLATARIKVGVVFDNVMIFATGGLALSNLDSNSSSETIWTSRTIPPITKSAAYGTGSSSSTAAGWAVSGGVEYRFAPNWSVFAEYMYYSLSDSYNVTVNGNPQVSGPGSSTYRVKVDGDGQIFRIGLNYAFWSYPAPVAPAVVAVRY